MDVEDVDDLIVYGERNSGLNLRNVKLEADAAADHVELRLWDFVEEDWVLQVYVMLSTWLVAEAARRHGNGEPVPVIAGWSRLGSGQARTAAHDGADPLDAELLAELLLMVPHPQARERIAALWSVSAWQAPAQTAPRHFRRGPARSTIVDRGDLTAAGGPSPVVVAVRAGGMVWHVLPERVWRWDRPVLEGLSLPAGSAALALPTADGMPYGAAGGVLTDLRPEDLAGFRQVLDEGGIEDVYVLAGLSPQGARRVHDLLGIPTARVHHSLEFDSWQIGNDGNIRPLRGSGELSRYPLPGNQGSQGVAVQSGPVSVVDAEELDDTSAAERRTPAATWTAAVSATPHDPRQTVLRLNNMQVPLDRAR